MRFAHVKRWPALLAFLFIIACSQKEASQTEALGETAPTESPASQVVSEANLSSPPQESKVAQKKKVSFYDDAEQWCEPPREYLCETSEDCPSWGGREMKCAKSLNGDYRHCVSKHTRSEQLEWRRRLAAVVDMTCKPKDGCKRHELRAYLSLEALKESSWRPWKRHRLNPDLEANRSSYFRQANRYGYNYDRKHGLVAQDEDANPYYLEDSRWTTGLGWYGQNAALFVHAWDPKAPPEVLCNEIIATEAALRRARRVVSKLESGVNCDEDPDREFHGLACDESGECHPSWYDVHNATQRGSLCPVGDKSQKAFARRAKRRDLNPFGRVTLEMLGRPIRHEGQDAYVAKMTPKLYSEASSGPKP